MKPEPSLTAPYIHTLQKAIRRRYDCRSNHIEAVPTEEVVQGKTVWKGVVEVFILKDHPKARVCYAWGYEAREHRNEVRVVTVLALPPVDSPLKAVRQFIDGEPKR
jgi:hypothetical protein